MEKRVIMPQRIRGPRHKKKKWYKERGRAGAREREREREWPYNSAACHKAAVAFSP